jgi:carbonic anhydrase
VRFEDLFLTLPKKKKQGIIQHKGSLTTPPYSETIHWIVKKYILEASPQQITAIEKWKEIMPDMCAHYMPEKYAVTDRVL